MKQIFSKDKKTCKLIYEKDNSFYYSIAYHNISRSSKQEYITVCISSQIGCSQNCLFCATGSHKHICNLTAEQICNEILDGIEVFSYVIKKNNISQIHVIFEGMGEAAFNFDACCEGFHSAWEEKLKEFSQIVLRFSTVAPDSFHIKLASYFAVVRNKYPNTSCQVKLSLHSCDTENRRKILCDKGLASVDQVIENYLEVARICNHPLVCNYVLMKKDDFFCNFTDDENEKAIRLLKNKDVIVLLGAYSETGRGFYSPDESIYEKWHKALTKEKIEVYITQLKGADIAAACGMLHYK